MSGRKQPVGIPDGLVKPPPPPAPPPPMMIGRQSAFGVRPPIEFGATINMPPDLWSPEARYTIEFTAEDGTVYRAVGVAFAATKQGTKK